MHKMVNFWTKLRASLWFIPGLMLISAIAMALGFIELDAWVGDQWLQRFPRVFGLGADGSRGMLVAIASSMLTVAALIFALTLNAMMQASGQFTPRIFRNFMRDRANQFALGYFVSIFVYCLVVLRTIRSGEDVQFVPSLAVLAGLLFALAGVLVLIFVIHHIANSLQITNIIHNIVDETKKTIQIMLPSKRADDSLIDNEKTTWLSTEDAFWIKIPALKCGYIQHVDINCLLKFSQENQLILRMERGVGQFVGRGATLISVHSNIQNHAVHSIETAKIKALNQFYGIDNHRTIEHDIDFGIRQIADIALKALSPGVDDTTTAVTCIDFIGEILGEIARRELPKSIRATKNGGRVMVKSPNFKDYVESAFDQIRISGKANLVIFNRLLEAAKFTAECTTDYNRRAILQQQIGLIAEYAMQTLETNDEKNKLSEKITEVNRHFDLNSN